MPKDNKEVELHSIEGVEVFSVGNWNGDEITLKDLNDIVQAYSETADRFMAPLKLGHDDDQKLLQKDGYPAAGWVNNLYVKGEKLLADFVDIPNKIMELIKNKAYRSKSIELYHDLPFGEKTYRRFLGAVSLLGADVPGVLDLNDILSTYYGLDAFKQKKVVYDKISDAQNLKIYDNFHKANKTETKMPKEIEELKSENTKLEGEVSKFKKENDKKEAELKEYKTKLEAIEAENKKFKRQALEAEVDKEISEMQKEYSIIPKSATPFIKELLLEDKKEYSVKVDEKETKFNKRQLLKHIFSLCNQASGVNFDENSTDDKLTPKKELEDKVEKEILKYASDNNVSYRKAYDHYHENNGDKQ